MTSPHLLPLVSRIWEDLFAIVTRRLRVFKNNCPLSTTRNKQYAEYQRTIFGISVNVYGSTVRCNCSGITLLQSEKSRTLKVVACAKPVLFPKRHMLILLPWIRARSLHKAHASLERLKTNTYSARTGN